MKRFIGTARGRSAEAGGIDDTVGEDGQHRLRSEAKYESQNQSAKLYHHTGDTLIEVSGTEDEGIDDECNDDAVALLADGSP
jgi:hypothetical protein